MEQLKKDILVALQGIEVKISDGSNLNADDLLTLLISTVIEEEDG